MVDTKVGIDMSGGIIPLLIIQKTMSAPTIIGVIVDESVPVTERTMIDESEAHFEAPIAET